MSKYRKKPVEIEAIKFNREPEPAPEWLTQAYEAGTIWYQSGDEPYIAIKTLEGEMRASVNDYIIKGLKGELYPCKSDIFEMSYDLVSE